MLAWHSLNDRAKTLCSLGGRAFLGDCFLAKFCRNTEVLLQSKALVLAEGYF